MRQALTDTNRMKGQQNVPLRPLPDMNILENSEYAWYGISY